jgi:predicted nucleic acid-binding Zn ribbon protein
MTEAWRFYAAGSEVRHFADFCKTNLIQSEDRWEGKPLLLEPWQRRFLDEERVNEERRAAYREQHPRVDRDCAECGRSFAGRPDALVCSDECRRVRRAERDKGRRARQREQRRASPTPAESRVTSASSSKRTSGSCQPPEVATRSS